jgi:hypothetical protein
VSNIPDRTTLWTFENRIGSLGAQALFEGVTAPKQHLKKEEKAMPTVVNDALYALGLFGRLRQVHGFFEVPITHSYRKPPK